MRKLLKHEESGYLLVGVMALTMFMAVLIASLSMLANYNMERAKSRILVLQAQYSAESGADMAIAKLNNDPSASYTGASETTILTTTKYKATFTSTVTAGSSGNEKIITATGKVYQPATSSTPRFTRKVEVVTQRTSSSISAAGMLSRNIIEIASSVKDIYAKDLYVNGFIAIDKNSSSLHAENIVVADKNTGASNCSIGGPGSLTKPTTFTNPGQTKTSIITAFNNCITPPGNTSNTNFDVLANQNTVAKVQSTYIPWTQYMDGTYQNSPGGCNDWVSGASPRSLPSTGNTKKTHYPDSGTNISTSCGNSGDLALGSNQFTVQDNIHVRANLCAATACDPIFNNPSASVRYIFVEGTVNFNSVTTASGSGPIVLIAYGADPSSKTSVCPYGGSMYVGGGTTNAPNMYFITMNGFCFDKTKFGSAISLGGISGKNIYISSNSGTPFDPQISTTFPVSSIPVDLAWHAARYRRL